MTVPIFRPFFARSIRSLTQLARESSMWCLRRIQGHRAPTTPKLVEGEGAIASRRGVAKLCSLAKAMILWQGKLAVESQRNLVWLTGLLLTSFRAAHNTIALQQNRSHQLQTTSLEFSPRGGGRKRNGTGKKTERPVPCNICSITVFTACCF